MAGNVAPIWLHTDYQDSARITVYTNSNKVRHLHTSFKNCFLEKRKFLKSGNVERSNSSYIVVWSTVLN